MPVTDRITLEKKYEKLQEILRSFGSVDGSVFGRSGFHISSESGAGDTWR